jgi:hypothetical protein
MNHTQPLRQTAKNIMDYEYHSRNRIELIQMAYLHHVLVRHSFNLRRYHPFFKNIGDTLLTECSCI